MTYNKPIQKRSTPDMTVRIKIYEALKLAIEKSDGKTCTYKPGESDAKIAQELDVKVRSVEHTRVSIFGKLPRAMASSVEARLTAIEEYLTRKNPKWRDDAELSALLGDWSE